MASWARRCRHPRPSPPCRAPRAAAVPPGPPRLAPAPNAARRTYPPAPAPVIEVAVVGLRASGAGSLVAITLLHAPAASCRWTSSSLRASPPSTRAATSRSSPRYWTSTCVRMAKRRGVASAPSPRGRAAYRPLTADKGRIAPRATRRRRGAAAARSLTARSCVASAHPAVTARRTTRRAAVCAE